MEKAQRPGPVLFGDRYCLWPPLEPIPAPLAVVHAFSDRWEIRFEKGDGGQWGFSLGPTVDPPYGCRLAAPAVFLSMESAAADLATTIEMRKGVRCPDCKHRFSHPGSRQHDECLPF